MKIVKAALVVLFGAVLISIFPAWAQSQATAPPDFSIRSIRIDPAELYANSDATIYVEVENAGTERVDNVQIVVNFSKLFGGESVTASLGPGETKIVTSRKYHPEPGNYEIRATLNLGGTAYGLEENKANNEKTIVVQVQEGRAPGTSPDLALTAVKIGEAGGTYQVEATVRNIGIDPATCVFNVYLVTEVTKGTRQVMKREDEVIPARQPFAPGAEKKMGPIPIVDKDHPGSLEEGTYNVKIGVHNTFGTYLEESDQKNNYYQGTFTAAERTTTPTFPAGLRTPKKPIRQVRADYFMASPLEILTGQEVLLKWSFPAAAEATLLIDGKKIPLRIPTGEMRVKPSCDPKNVSFCFSTCRIVGKTKTNEKFEREVRIKVKKR